MVWSKKIFILLLFTFLLFPFSSFISSSVSDSPELNIIHTSEEIPNIDLTQLPQIDYDSLNSQWYDSKIEMLIITPDNQSFVDAVQPLADWKNEKGVKTIILRNYSSYAGTDDAEKVRNMIKSYYETENIQWVLLAGDAGNGADEIPIRYVFNNDVLLVEPQQTESSGGDNEYKPTDFYYSDLTGSWDDDDDNKWGESALNSAGGDEINWTPDVYVGRLPADNAVQLGQMINKTLKYETDPYIGDWMNKMLLAGGVSDKESSGNLEDEAVLTTYIWNHWVKHEMNFTHLHQQESSYDPPTPPAPNIQEYITGSNFDSYFDSGFSTVIAAGHGAASVINDKYDLSYTSGQASSSSNTDMPSLFYADACTTSPYDVSDDNVGENLIKREYGGAIGYIGGSRVTWYYQDDNYLDYLNRGCAKLFWKEFFYHKNFQQGKALYDAKAAYLQSDIFDSAFYSMDKEWERKNVLTYNLLGDPEVDIYTQTPGNLSNYFLDDYYEGQRITFTVTDNKSRVVPYPRIHLNTTDGKYRTVYGDINGNVMFRLPKQANESYDVIMTGHNLIPTHFNFTTLEDPIKPEILSSEFEPLVPSVSDNVCFNIEAYDNYSGIEGVFVLLSKDNFNTFEILRCSNESQTNENMFIFEHYKLDPGDYSYVIVARDYANNTEIFYQGSYALTIPIPLTDYVLVVVTITIIAVAGVSIIVGVKGQKKHENLVNRLERL